MRHIYYSTAGVICSCWNSPPALSLRVCLISYQRYQDVYLERQFSVWVRNNIPKERRHNVCRSWLSSNKLHGAIAWNCFFLHSCLTVFLRKTFSLSVFFWFLSLSDFSLSFLSLAPITAFAPQSTPCNIPQLYVHPRPTHLCLRAITDDVREVQNTHIHRRWCKCYKVTCPCVMVACPWHWCVVAVIGTMTV